MVHQLASEFAASKDERYVASVIHLSRERQFGSVEGQDGLPNQANFYGCAHRLQGVAANDGSTSHPRKP